MEVVYARCAGLDVHKKKILACVRVASQRGSVERQVKTFGATTGDLMIMSDWLRSHAVTHVAMESTGIFWKPIYAILEGTFTLLVVNAAHIKAVPGRKTDVRCWRRSDGYQKRRCWFPLYDAIDSIHPCPPLYDDIKWA